MNFAKNINQFHRIGVQLRKILKQGSVNFLSEFGKVNANVLMDCVMNITDLDLGEKPFGFRKNNSCRDHVFVIKVLCKKAKEIKKTPVLAFMNLRKHRTEAGGLWK